MPNCGIEKYDKLPARVGWIDVDFLRWRLGIHNSPHWIVRFIYAGFDTKERCVELLDDAVEKYSKNKDKTFLKCKHRNEGRCYGIYTDGVQDYKCYPDECDDYEEK